jgi:hypothetical protein
MDEEQFCYYRSVWEKFDDSQMDNITLGGYTPRNVAHRPGAHTPARRQLTRPVSRNTPRAFESVEAAGDCTVPRAFPC